MIKPDDNIIDYVDDYVHGLLSPEDAETVERYCETSRLGKVALEEAQKRYEAMQALPPSEASERLIQRTVRNIEMKEDRRGKLRKNYGRTVLLATAASVLIIGGLNAYYYHMKASPYDLRLLGQNELLAGSGASMRVAVFDRNTQRPIAGVPVQIALYNPSSREQVELASLTTDDRGAVTPRFDLPDWEDGRYELRVTARPSKAKEILSQPIQLRREWRLMVSTDKPVYQPGQTIRLRSLALRKPDLKPLAGNEVIFTITDPKGNVIFKQKDVTSRFGISSADCPLATEIIEGEYKIQCTVGATTSDRSVTVEKYVLPKFKVGVTLDKPFYAPGEQVAGNVQADYFFGKPVVGGNVDIDVRATDIGQHTIASLTEKTDSDGKAEFRFRLPDRMVGREQDDGSARFMLVATVTDTAGQKYSKGTSRTVTANPIHLEIIPESGTLVQGVANTIYVFTSYADGRPARTRLVVHGHEKEIETGKLGVASFEITPETDTVGITVKATDFEGRIGRKHARLACGSFDGDFLIRPDRAVYSGGETMKLVTLGGGVEPVFVDFIKDGQTILTQQIEMDGDGGQYDFDLPPEIFGTLEICAYRFRAHDLAVRKSRTVYVRQARQLIVKATLNQDEYRPGAKATVKLTLTGPDGKPAPGAISLKAVDEAVYSVLSQQSGMERTFFLLEQELLEPVYTIYPGWSPGLFTELPIFDRIQFEQALFSKTVQHIEGPQALPDAFFTGAQQALDVPPFPFEDTDVAMDRAVIEYGDPGRSPFTLAATSFPEKVRQVNAARSTGLFRMTIAWISLAGALALSGILAFAIFHPKAFLITALVCTTLFCVICVPAGVVMTFMVARTHQNFADVAAAVPDAVMLGAMDGAEMDFDEAPMEEFEGEDPAAKSEPGQGGAPPRVRQWFPETLLWRPELITDDNGEVTLDVELADSITTWRLTTSAVSSEGQLGGADFSIKVFQPFFVDFNLPVSLTRNDEVGVPVVVYNYLDKPQTVNLTLKGAEWFERLDTETEGEEEGSGENNEGDAEEESGDNVMKLELGPGEIRSLNFPIKVLKVGRHQLEVTTIASGVADAIRRQIEVVSDGRRVEQVASGTLSEPLEMTLSVPQNAIDGSVRAIVKLYPSSFSQLVEGLDAIFQMPYGCFEQTSSTTYPNVLALDYLRRAGKSVPQVEAKARQYIHLGHQRLISFEVDGGGFDWFGNPPANRTLTAYGLMEFEDMANVYDVDPRLIERTRDWLLAQRKPDGSWPNEAGMLDDGLAGSVNHGGNLDLACTAYIAWAVFGNGKAASEAASTLDFLLAHPPESINDPYLLAVTASAIGAIDPNHSELGSYLARLDAMKKSSPDGKKVWWEQAPGGRTTFHGSGQAGSVETTAVATLALLDAGQYPGTARAALTWLVEQKDPNGIWYSTQATVLSLKALLKGTGAALGGEKERKIDIAWGGETVRDIVIPVDQADVMQQINLSDMLTPGNDYQLHVTDRTDTATGYQVTFRYHVEETGEAIEPEQESLSIDISYDRERLNVDDTVTAVATVINNMDVAAPMVILDLPIPGGFVIDPGELDELVGSQKIAKYEITARKAIVYLRRLDPDESLQLRYRLRATMPVKVAVPDAQVYEYYDPSKRGKGGATRLEAIAI